MCSKVVYREIYAVLVSQVRGQNWYGTFAVLIVDINVASTEHGNSISDGHPLNHSSVFHHLLIDR